MASVGSTAKRTHSVPPLAKGGRLVKHHALLSTGRRLDNARQHVLVLIGLPVEDEHRIPSGQRLGGIGSSNALFGQSAG
jgi:hypothetical protein